MRIPSPCELQAQLPLTSSGERLISLSRETIRRICLGKENRLLIIVGPCSIHNISTALEYARRLKILAEEFKSACFLVMRAYLEKPRTHTGWRGFIHDPYLDESYEIAEGLSQGRRLLCELAEWQIPAAMEFVTPYIAPYLEDLISWGCIGARTSASQLHRLLASNLPMPVGFKNSIDGNIDIAISGVLFARRPHIFLHTDKEGQLIRCISRGNSTSHVVLRGSQSGPNYDASTITAVLNKLRRLELPTRLLVDCSHGNCQKNYAKQKEVFQTILERNNPHICGLMLESHLEAGSQLLEENQGQCSSSISITDPCIDFDSTAALIEAAVAMAHR